MPIDLEKYLPNWLKPLVRGLDWALLSFSTIASWPPAEFWRRYRFVSAESLIFVALSIAFFVAALFATRWKPKPTSWKGYLGAGVATVAILLAKSVPTAFIAVIIVHIVGALLASYWSRGLPNDKRE